MATDSWSGLYYPEDGADVDLADIWLTQTDSAKGRVIPSFASTTARNSAFAASTLTSAQKIGATAHVQGIGLTYYTGSQWRRVPGDTYAKSAADGSAVDGCFTQAALALVDCEATGLAYIGFPLAFGGKPVVTATRYTAVYGPEGLSVAINDNASGAVTSAGFHVYVTRSNGTPYDSWVHISYVAVGPRAAD